MQTINRSEPNAKMSDKPQSVPLQPVVLFSDSFSHPARSKLEFLQGMGGRVVELVLEDCDGKTVHINRWGRCVWTNPKQNLTGQGMTHETGKAN